MVLRRGVVLFVDGNSGVDDFWGDGLFVDDRLDRLVDVMVDMLALDSWCSCCGVSGLVGMGGVLELSSFSFESLTRLVFVAVMEFLVDYWLHLVMMLLGEDFLVLDWLDRGVIVILVDLAVDSFLDFLMSGGLDVLVYDTWGDALGNIGRVASLASKACDCGLGFFHVEMR